MRLHADCRISTARPERQCRPLISAHSRQSVDGFSDPHANRSARRWVYPLLSCGFWVTLLSSGSPAWAAGKGANKERGTDLWTGSGCRSTWALAIAGASRSPRARERILLQM